MPGQPSRGGGGGIQPGGIVGGSVGEGGEVSVSDDAAAGGDVGGRAT